jgi:D-3-phosphoglycerate dehydrogenase
VAVAAAEPTKPTILVAEKLGDGGVDMLKAVGTVDCSYDMTKDELLAKISLVDAIVIRSATKVCAGRPASSVIGRSGRPSCSQVLHPAW